MSDAFQAALQSLIAKATELAATRQAIVLPVPIDSEPAAKPISEVKQPKPHKAFLLPRNLARLSTLAADAQHCRFGATTGVRVERLHGRYRADATNGRYLGVVKGKLTYDANDYPTVPALESAPNGATVAYIPADAWNQAFRAIPKRRKNDCGKPILDNLAVVLGENQATLVSTDLEKINVLTPRLVEGRFPDTDRVLPQGKPKLSIRVDPKLLIELLTVAADFRPEEEVGVQMDFYDDRSPFAVRVMPLKDGEDQEFTGLLVPLVRS